MGIVYRALDTLLDREVAVKVLRSTGGSRSRFFDEARVTSQLTHPGIPAIYDLGLVDGIPFLAMKLIKGETLAEKIRRSTTPAARGELIADFETICQAVAYAHERRVVHRDLKPSNVMVGAFGVVQVMDWGLAKKLTGSEPVNEPPTPAEVEPLTDIRTVRQEGEGTAPGSALGTAAFSPPEQAGGELDRMDERVDVFGLGAILCTVLTGQPPYVADSPEAVRLMAIRGALDAALARLDRSGADHELVALCRRCLAPNREERPRDANAVAAAVAAYRAGVESRLRAAERNAAVALAREAEQRKRRRVQLAFAGVSALAVVGTLAGLWWSEKRAADRLREAEAGADLALTRADELAARATRAEGKHLSQADAAVGLWREAAAAAERAQAVVAPSHDPELIARVGRRVEAVRAELARAEVVHRRAHRAGALLTALENAHGSSADQKRQRGDPRTARAYREAFAAAGLPVGASPEVLASAIRDEDPDVRPELLVSLDHWAWCLRGDPDAARLRAAANLADEDPFRREVRLAVGADDAAALVGLAARPEVERLPPVTATLLGRALADRGEYRAAAALLRAARDRHPGDYWLLIELSYVLWELPPGEKEARAESLACIWAALAVRPESAKTHNRLGYCLSARGDVAAAEASYRRATRLDPALPEAWHNLGVAALNRGDLDEAERAYRTAVACDPQFALPLGGLGFVQLRKGQLREAEASLRRALLLNPTDAPALLNLGHILERRGDISGAVAAYERAVAHAPGSAVAHSNRGETRLWLADWTGARHAFERAVELDPRFGPARRNLGWSCVLRNDLDRAEACFRTVLELDPRDARAVGSLGWVRELKGDPQGAADYQREAARLDPSEGSANAFHARRLAAAPRTAAELKRVLDDSLIQHCDRTNSQQRSVRSAAAVAALWYARQNAFDPGADGRAGFRRTACELLAGVVGELEAELGAGASDLAREAVASTANWLGDVGFARVRHPFGLATLPSREAVEWVKLWGRVRTVREKCITPPK